MNIDYDYISSFAQVLSYERSSIERCKSVFADRVVFDLGACDGLWTYAALQAGAKRVYAVDIAEDKCKMLYKRFSETGRFEVICCRVGTGLTSETARVNGDVEPGFIKMDVEGDEIDALIGMQDKIKKLKPHFMIEVHGDVEKKNKIVQMLREWMGREPSGENWILQHIYHLYYLPRDI